MTSILVDSGTRAVLAASDSVSGIVFLNECMIDTYHVPNVDRPHYLKKPFLAAIPTTDYPSWSWKKLERRFAPTLPDLVSDDLRARSELASIKLATFLKVQMHLNTARSRLVSGTALQETVYSIKFIEAMRFRDCGYDEARILEFPFVLQYSEIAGISLNQAADDIYLKARFDAHYLLNTEGLRLKYFAILKAARHPCELEGVSEAFRAEMFSNVAV